MKAFRALTVLLVLFGSVELLDHFSHVRAQGYGLPWTDTCKSEQNTCVANYTNDVQDCQSGCNGDPICRRNCTSQYNPERIQCNNEYGNCLSGRAQTCQTYCSSVTGSTTTYARYDETSGPKCQCGSSSGNACGGTPLACNNGTATCQYDSSSQQFGYTCPQCYGSAPTCTGGANGQATCQNDSSGFGQWICPSGGCGTTPAPSCTGGVVASCSNGSWTCPPPPPPGGGGGGGGGNPPEYCSDPANPATCCTTPKPACPNPSCDNAAWYCDSPIIIDTRGEGFHLTNAQKGVLFDFYGNGHPLQLSWTDPAYSNGWLALDRNGNGTIDDATELFGNTTPQTPSGDQNGFLALAEFDKPENGGNADGFIDSDDAVYSKLRVWIDANHNGYSEPNELYTLKQLGIERIELHYRVSSYSDKYGNQFRYTARIWDDKGLHPDHRTYDVYLQQAP